MTEKRPLTARRLNKIMEKDPNSIRIQYRCGCRYLFENRTMTQITLDNLCEKSSMISWGLCLIHKKLFQKQIKYKKRKAISRNEKPSERQVPRTKR